MLIVRSKINDGKICLEKIGRLRVVDIRATPQNDTYPFQKISPLSSHFLACIREREAL